MITQLLVDHGGLFDSWQPYTDLVTFTYHFGFHADSAVFHWLTGLDVPGTVLWVGQILNILAVMALYPLAVRIVRNRWAGVVAVLIAGLLSPMPMYYPNWGRYTQLAGQAILPLVAWASWEFLAADLSVGIKRSKGILAIIAVAFAGLALTHYRVLILALIFLGFCWLLYLRRQNVKQMLLRVFWMGAGSMLLFLPWFIRVFGSRIMQMFARRMTTSAAHAMEVDPPHSGGSNISFFLPYILLLLIPVIISIGAWRREKGVLLIGGWWFISFLAANPAWLGLPGAGVLSSDAVSMALYFPAAILIGVAAGWLASGKSPPPGWRLFVQKGLFVLFGLLIIGAGLWGARLRQKDVQPAIFSLAAFPDLEAARWIQQNTPSDARFLVNSFPMFTSATIVGSDGGYWLPLLARRADTVPPLNYGFEREPYPGFAVSVRDMTLEIQSKGIQDSAVLSRLRDKGVSFIYIGQRQGKVNSPGPLFTYSDLLADSAFETVYHQDQVWVFKINPSP